MPTPSPSKDMREAFYRDCHIAWCDWLKTLPESMQITIRDSAQRGESNSSNAWNAAWLAASALAEKRCIAAMRAEQARWNENHGYIAPGKIHLGVHALDLAIDRIEKGQP